ncbi:MAG TPA: ABC transporter ATP-binding protein [Ktedonobacterales bacterium]|nr:ABC transporter ATP-binding protein [Ktedonobacterales bacterium]
MSERQATDATERFVGGGSLPLLDVRDVTMRYRQGRDATITALADLSLHVNAGEFVALVGPSGCGKSTLLSLVAGFETPSAGTIALNGDTTTTRLGRVGYMPQRDLLLPWRRALDNAIAGLQVKRVPRGEARERARALFAEFGLAGFERSYPPALSGGMRQRVSFARTVLAGGDLLLLDEPFGALDALTRADLQRWLLAIWERLHTTCLLVTHDVDEALLLSDRFYALSPRPGHVRLERSVPLPRPRDAGMLARPEVAALKAEMLAALMERSLSEGAAR